jgi:hypothetical protein
MTIRAAGGVHLSLELLDVKAEGFQHSSDDAGAQRLTAAW